MAIKRYRLYCQHCHYNRLSDGADLSDLVEIPQAEIQGNIPHLDPVTKKTIAPKSKKRPKRFRCPDCGRMIAPKKLPAEKEINVETNRTDGSEAGTPGQEI
jgi:hypothetical protein